MLFPDEENILMEKVVCFSLKVERFFWRRFGFFMCSVPLPPRQRVGGLLKCVALEK
jgi:hypothetical protein